MGHPPVSVQLNYTDADNSLVITSNTAMIATGIPVVTTTLSLPITSSGVGTGNISHAIPITFAPNSGVPITYSTSYSAGAGCMVGQNYTVRPWLEEIK